MSVVLALPYSPPAPEAAPFAPVVSTVKGWDGSVWDVTDWRSGVFLKGGVRGLTGAAQERHSDVAPGLAGSLYNGFRAQELPVFWPVCIFHDGSSAEWVARDRAWWRILRPGKTLEWSVTTPGGETRTLTCRFENDGDHSFDRDPVAAGWAAYKVYLVADEDPFWRGEPVEDTWHADTPATFFGSGAPDFNIASDAASSTAKMTNPGDVDAWPIWVVDGPTTSVSLGVGGDVVEVPFGVASGKRLVIDTNPTEQTALLGNPDPDDPFGVLAPTDRTTDLGAVDFAEIPADATTNLSVTIAGAGTVSMRIVPGYWRAW